MTQEAVMTLTKDYIAKVKVTVYPYLKSVSGPQFLTAMLDLDNILHNCCHDPKGCYNFDATTYFQGQGHSA